MFTRMKIMFPLLAFLLFGLAIRLDADFFATDPGVRGGPPGAGDHIDGISENERKFFEAGLEAFREVQSVQGGTIEGEETEPGLGPRFNLDSCAGCHAQPAVGGTSPFTNPQVEVANKAGATNVVPDFIIKQGPVREARFKFNPDGTRDGGVHDLFTITGRTDAVGCNIAQPDFKAAEANDNLIFRIPTPLFGAGLIQAIDDSTILANKNSNVSAKLFFGISGRVNRNPNDGTITRFGWKAQVKSPDIFSGEAYNVEQGVTNDLFPQERDETIGCRFNATPENHTNV
ncbi:MAG: thiol oxidoreductase, partial [Nitrospirae bacterium]